MLRVHSASPARRRASGFFSQCVKSPMSRGAVEPCHTNVARSPSMTGVPSRLARASKSFLIESAASVRADQLAQHERQDPTVAEVLELGGVVDAGDHREGPAR